jgi:hypothetical protein
MGLGHVPIGRLSTANCQPPTANRQHIPIKNLISTDFHLALSKI